MSWVQYCSSCGCNFSMATTLSEVNASFTCVFGLKNANVAWDCRRNLLRMDKLWKGHQAMYDHSSEIFVGRWELFRGSVHALSESSLVRTAQHDKDMLPWSQVRGLLWNLLSSLSVSYVYVTNEKASCNLICVSKSPEIEGSLVRLTILFTSFISHE